MNHVSMPAAIDEAGAILHLELRRGGIAFVYGGGDLRGIKRLAATAREQIQRVRARNIDDRPGFDMLSAHCAGRRHAHFHFYVIEVLITNEFACSTATSVVSIARAAIVAAAKFAY